MSPHTRCSNKRSGVSHRHSVHRSIRSHHAIEACQRFNPIPFIDTSTVDVTPLCIGALSCSRRTAERLSRQKRPADHRRARRRCSGAGSCALPGSCRGSHSRTCTRTGTRACRCSAQRSCGCPTELRVCRRERHGLSRSAGVCELSASGHATATHRRAMGAAAFAGRGSASTTFSGRVLDRRILGLARSVGLGAWPLGATATTPLCLAPPLLRASTRQGGVRRRILGSSRRSVQTAAA